MHSTVYEVYVLTCKAPEPKSLDYLPTFKGKIQKLDGRFTQLAPIMRSSIMA